MCSHLLNLYSTPLWHNDALHHIRNTVANCVMTSGWCVVVNLNSDNHELTQRIHENIVDVNFIRAHWKQRREEKKGHRWEKKNYSSTQRLYKYEICAGDGECNEKFIWIRLFFLSSLFSPFHFTVIFNIQSNGIMSIKTLFWGKMIEVILCENNLKSSFSICNSFRV